MKILQFLQDEKGMFSSTRLVFIIWGIGVFVVWAIVSIRSTTPGLVQIDTNMMLVLLSLMTGKAVQKFGESKGESKGEKPPDEAKPTVTGTVTPTKG
ncbi:hypothetical protein KKE26_02715 [bacterium]|nr:hypothetical protein [bacterium]